MHYTNPDIKRLACVCNEQWADPDCYWLPRSSLNSSLVNSLAEFFCIEILNSVKIRAKLTQSNGIQFTQLHHLLIREIMYISTSASDIDITMARGTKYLSSNSLGIIVITL